jgi:hypothetical protein
MDDLPGDLENEMNRSLAEVERQLRELPWTDLVDQEDLEWSLDGPDGWSFFIEALRLDHDGLRARVEIVCNANRPLRRRRELTRLITIDRLRPS